MNEKFVSPGVFTKENDQTFLQQGVGEISGAFVGPTEKGPAFEPITVTSPREYIETFGRSGEYYLDYAVINYLRDAGSATVIRVLGGSPSAVEEGVAGYTSDIFEIRESNSADLGFNDSQASLESDVLCLLAPTGNAPDSIASNISISGPGSVFSSFELDIDGRTYMVSLDPSRRNYVTNIFGTDPQGPREVYVIANFKELHEEIAEKIGQSTISDFDIELLARGNALDYSNRAYNNASTPWIQSQDLLEEQPSMTERVDLFRFHTFTDGRAANRNIKVAIQEVRTPEDVAGSQYGLFDVVIREFSDNDQNQNVLESYVDLTLDPTSPNYLPRVIGNRTTVFNPDGSIDIRGEYENASSFVRVEMNKDVERANANDKNDNSNLVPWGFQSYLFPYDIDTTSILPHGLKVRESQSRVDGEYSAVDTGDWFETSAGSLRKDENVHYGFDFSYESNLNFLNPVQSGIDVEDVKNISTDFNFSDVVGYNSITDENSFDQTEQSQRKFILGFQGGFDGYDPSNTINVGEDITAENTQGLDCSAFNSFGTLGYFDAFGTLTNQDEYDVNLLSTPGIQNNLHPAVIDGGIDLVEQRRDAFYILDAVGPRETVKQATLAVSGLDTSYGGTYFPWLRVRDNTTNQIVSLPPSVLIPRVYAFNDQVGDPWFAPAGLQRGGIPEAREAVKKLNKASRDKLYQSRINPINDYSDQGVVVFGQKTLQTASSALDRINVRRLLITAKKFIASTARFLNFQQNTQETRQEFISVVEPYLDSVQQRQGLTAFRVKMDSDNNPPEVVDRNILVGEIFLQPSRTSEFIQIDFNILPTGATFDD